MGSIEDNVCNKHGKDCESMKKKDTWVDESGVVWEWIMDGCQPICGIAPMWHVAGPDIMQILAEQLKDRMTEKNDEPNVDDDTSSWTTYSKGWLMGVKEVKEYPKLTDRQFKALKQFRSKQIDLHFKLYDASSSKEDREAIIKQLKEIDDEIM